MSISGQHDFEGIERASQFVSYVLHEMKRQARPGMSTKELDFIAEKLFKTHGAQSAPKLTYDFPAYTCISRNHNFAHGIPKENEMIQKGDLINIDVSAELDGYFADTGHSFQIKPYSEDVQRICESTKDVLNFVLSKIKAGTKLNQIGKMIDQQARRNGYKTIKNLCSHGVGRALHEEPHYILNYYERSQTGRLKDGMVITIEPFLSTYDREALETGDGWTLTTRNRSLVAQHEHTLIVTKNKPMVMTYFH